MFIKSSIVALIAASSLPLTYGRFLIVERDGRAIFPRRFNQETCGGISGKIGSACAGNICGVLGGKTIGTLLAASPECAQQDLADDIIDASKDQDAATAATMVELAIQFRQCEKNTPPDFTKNPPALRNSVFCQKAPRNEQLNGLTQGQDPANDPTLFFDPALKITVIIGTQANTAPFGGVAAVNNNANDDKNVDVAANCPAPKVTVTVTVDAAVATETAAAAVETKAADANIEIVNDNSGALDFGDCTNPGLEFGFGFDGRKATELSFQPQNRDEFPQSSALNAAIVPKAICDILHDKCKAPDATNAACQEGRANAAKETGGKVADVFNLALGIISNFAEVQAAPVEGAADSADVADGADVAADGKADFNKCSTPAIEFGVGFDGRKEESFRPVDANDFNHGSAKNAGIITDFVCDQLVNQCDSNQVAIDDCAAAIQATAGLAGQALADAFNKRVSQNV